MASDEPRANWRNFAAWGAVGAIVYILGAWGASSLLHEDGMGAIVRSKEVIGKAGLGLLFAAVWVGFSSRKRPVNLNGLRNFAIWSAAAIVVCLLGLWVFGALVGTGAMGASEWAATGAGLAFIVLAFLGILGLADAHMGAHFMETDPAEDMRERGRLFLYSWVWLAAVGLLLVVLSLAAPGGVLAPASALACALPLIAALCALGIATWRLSDELMRTLSHETGNLAFYLMLVLGGGWAMLAHLGFVNAPLPLDWLTLFAVLLFAASFIAVGRRRMLGH